MESKRYKKRFVADTPRAEARAEAFDYSGRMKRAKYLHTSDWWSKYSPRNKERKMNGIDKEVLRKMGMAEDVIKKHEEAGSTIGEILRDEWWPVTDIKVIRLLMGSWW